MAELKFNLSSYGKQALSAAIVALRHSLELGVKTGDLKTGDVLTDEELQRVVEEYEQSFLSLNKKVHKAIKQKIGEVVTDTLKPGDGQNDDGQNEDDEQNDKKQNDKKQSKKRPRRPKLDISEFVQEKPQPTRCETDEAFKTLLDNLLEQLNAKFLQQNVTFQCKDTPNTPLVKIMKTQNGKETVYAFVSKAEFDRKREVRPKKGAEGDVTSVDTENVSGLTVVKCFNEEKELVTVFKIEHLKKGDVLKSGTTVPAVKGNVLTDFNDVLAKMSLYGVNGVVDDQVQPEQVQPEQVHFDQVQHNQVQSEQVQFEQVQFEQESNSNQPETKKSKLSNSEEF